ncbi:hypothetical protein [Haloplanus pelagicus]|uniref:hypothetical protein n=1 Tax=Haloplanus pelagicus TaxID=2949995 RepID=UPI00203DFB63|nr:hypothetical protein [Haloplanus sp. HW8-1]
MVCGDPADGVDAPTRQPICRRCASIRCDGGQEIRPGRRRVTSSITFGGASSNYVSTPDEDVNHLSGEVSIKVSGASSDYPHPTRLQREIEAAVADVLDDYADRVSDDVDRGDGVETDGGEDQFSVRVGEMVREIEEDVEDSTKAEAMLYARCSAAFEDAVNTTDLPPENALGVMTAALFEAADTVGYARSDVIETAREHYVDGDDVDRGDGVETDGGRNLYTCDTPTCDGEKEVITPDGYVCRDCADALAVQYEEVDRGDGVVSDGGLLTGGGRYHVVCSDCTYEHLKRERHQAARAVDDHRTDEPSHDVRFEEVRGR